ncbi:MAG: hypothetical protein WCF61_05960 [Terriglobales bacterium]
MKPKHFYAGFAGWCVLIFALVPNIRAQQTIPLRHIGAVHDWSEHQIIFSRNALARHPNLLDREPRLRQQVMERWQSPQWRALLLGSSPPPIHPKNSLERDWNFPGLGARLRENAFPAKFSYNPEASPDCINDYVVFGLSVVGVNGGQANLVAFNNLYVNDTGTGYCSGTAPLLMFAYNVSTNGGKIDTSPVPSLDGQAIAFVETAAGTGGAGVFHVLTWTAGQGTIGGAVTPTASQMSALVFSTDPSTSSSPWIDFSGDTAYVGDAVGKVYQITSVFNGTPKLSGNPGWPVTVSNNYNLTPPVLDSNQGLLMVGSLNGNLYSIETSTGAVATLAIGAGTSPGIIAPPIVDITNGTTFVVDADNGAVAGSGGGAVLVQVNTSSMVVLSTGLIGEGASAGTKMRLFQPAFSNAYFSDPANGVVSLCGTGAGDTTPNQYVFGFTGTTMNPLPNPGYPLQLSKTGTADRCTGWTEFYNPNAGPTTNITAVSITSDVVTVSTINSLTVGEEVYIQGATAATFLNGQTLIVTGLVGSSPPYGGFTANFTHADYPQTADTGTVSIVDAITATAVASDVLTVTTNTANLTVGENVYIQGTAESFLNGQIVAITGLLGSGPLYTGFTANFTAADYSNPSDTGTVSAGTDFFFFGLTGDCTAFSGGPPNGCVVAMGNNAGNITATVAPVVGGPSGIVVDNYSTAAEASSIYLMSLSDDTAYKFTQEGLN